MKALDTNALVRFLVNDDARQATRVKKLLLGAEQSGDRFLIVVPVLLELLWVLSSVYRRSRDEVLDAIEELTLLQVLEFEESERVHRLIGWGRMEGHDLADMLIALTAVDAGCTGVLTFDGKTARAEPFEMI